MYWDKILGTYADPRTITKHFNTSSKTKYLVFNEYKQKNISIYSWTFIAAHINVKKHL